LPPKGAQKDARLSTGYDGGGGEINNFAQSRVDGHAREEGFSPAGAGPLRRAASFAAIARLSARP
jgi:hypothetical protein